MNKTPMILAACTASVVGLMPALASERVLTSDFSRLQPGEATPAGALTVPRRASDKAFSAPVANLSPDQDVDFRLGNALSR